MSMNGFTYDTILHLSLSDGDTEREIRVSIDYTYFPAFTPGIPRGEYAPLDPPEPASVEIGNVRLRLGDQPIDCPPFVAQLIYDDEGLYRALLNDAENTGPSGDGQPDERQEWRDFDPDC